MKLTDYLALFLRQKGVTHVFAVSGGASLHLIDSVRRCNGMQIICPLHEQAAAMAADGYSRSSGRIGAAIATSGPGATNLLTGIACAYYDSVPAIYFTGQVASFRLKGNSRVRQRGFQETEIVEMCRPITKYAVQVVDPASIGEVLDAAYRAATTGRMGPVLIDIPDDLQRAEVAPGAPEDLGDAGDQRSRPPDSGILPEAYRRAGEFLSESDRPILVIGAGVRLAGAEREIAAIVERWAVPFVCTWAAVDLFSQNHPMNVGTFGTHGTRHANFAVQNADLILSIGCRLDTKATGSPAATFARAARKIVIDIDPCELNKFADLLIDLTIRDNAKAALRYLLRVEPRPRDWRPWVARINGWKERYPVCPPGSFSDRLLNPYALVKAFSRVCPDNTQIFLDTGCLLAWMMQAFERRGSQRVFHDWNNTAMGWSLPAAIGGYFARPDLPTFCLIGDGSLQMNIQELATVALHRLPIKILLFNNHGYSMIRQTQDQWFDSQHFASSAEGGVADPAYEQIAQAYGIKTMNIRLNAEADAVLAEMLKIDGPVLCQLELDSTHRVVPQVKFGRPNEDAEPLLDRDTFRAEMIIPPHPLSLAEHPEGAESFATRNQTAT